MNNRLFILTILLFLGSIEVSDAARRVRGQPIISPKPYWEVGKIDPFLTAACRRGEFGQNKVKLTTIGFIGQRGRSVTGMATSNWNLVDRKRLAKPNMSYHFFNEGYSNCKVYSWPSPPRKR
jgi:hypothetical protein